MVLRLRNPKSLCLIVFILLFTTVASARGQQQIEYSAEVAFPNLAFNQPDGIVADPTNNSQLFVLEQTGTIKGFNINPSANTTTVFLDLSDRVLYGGEQGLLGLAFHPQFSSNGLFYVDYVADNPRRSVISQFSVAQDDPSIADENSERIVLEISQPYSNHNGGQLAFGPDGYLYIGVGDGGSAGDPSGNGQDLSVLLGKILRIDVDLASAGRNYGVPANNPFVGNTLGHREEIYAYGFRNPWRFSFDLATGELWVGDVGQNHLEEIDIVEIGKNYGWNIMEGSLCYNPSGCDQTGLELPVWNYTRDLGTAVVGGYVYHGNALPNLKGAYIYGDYGSGRIWALTNNGSNYTNTLIVDTKLNVASFGLDQEGELYFSAYDGKIYSLHSVIIPEFPLTAGIAIFLILSVMLCLLTKIAIKTKAKMSNK